MSSNKPTDMIKFMAFLVEACQCVDRSTPTEINSGGCGVFAKLLSEHLTKHNINHKIYALWYDLKGGKTSDEGLKNFKEFVTNGNNVEKAGEDHMMILVEDFIYVDSTGVSNYGAMKADVKEEISYETLVKLVDKGKWNPLFDRGCTEFMDNKMTELFNNWENFTPGSLPFPEKEVELSEYTIKIKKRQDPFFGLLGGRGRNRAHLANLLADSLFS